ncbi:MULTISPECIES: DEAD/DEAH box helicase [Turicibacter]|jgi:ATP-dependent RNA helicase dbpA family protein|uniref:DEAD-box ATP-dependent RNA helicase CshB n=2 Tax=Turicibacter sanguinis TaxID=154288 RepID=A0A173RTV7_9FIRM|nr:MULTISPECIES: DEAD/DEAH box helicase [Turicibacter]EFF64818.1 ATP-dependent RNA helicase DbpA family protein [Turicibacter sanguinis PC909]EGC93084.1 DEAD-box ATP-dependent RNA helicase CshB [Turicibacter sp. HGF1]MBP3903332.1 DEAD/DEAH box helicase [Turicibacter sp.]MCU7192198.1 DEAD/DEAH box helicase [Turicibacter sanguinis]MCU7196551.1 DEAD/DEAH box helicase [Turicibacter sanguinis]
MSERFQDLNIKPYLKAAIEDLHFEELTQIQEQVIPLALEGKDIIGQSQTGSGKTHAFLIPIFESLKEDVQQVQAVITTPTRELAEQIYIVASHLASFSETPIKIGRYVGGTDKKQTIERLGVQPQIVIGTPGRIKDLAINERALLVHTAKMFVVDEADMTLETGFLTDIDQIAGTMGKDLQMMVFSATIPQALKPFLKKYMTVPTHIHIQPRQQTAVKINHILYPTKHRSRVNIVANLLKTINPYLAIIFVNTKQHATEVSNALTSQGLQVGQIHGDLTPRQRRQMMQRIRNLDFQYIVATDIAARGIDIEGVSHVINYELPQDLEFYIHRVGRTARGNYDGVAITLYDSAEEELLQELEERGIKFNYKELKNGELVTVNARNSRQKREKKENEIDKIAKAKVRKPKKVTPGYKKKMKFEMDKVKRQERRKRK